MRRGWSREKKHEQYMQVMVMMTLMIIVMMIVIMMIMVMKVLILMMKRIYMQVMEAVTLFTDIVQFPNLHKLDFGEIPRTIRFRVFQMILVIIIIIRFRVFQMIPRFTELRVLIIGPGTSGAWIPIKVRRGKIPFSDPDLVVL